MLKIKQIIFIALALAALPSCKLVFKAAGVYKDPQPETVQSVKLYMGEDGKYDGLYRATSDSSLKYFIDSIGHSIPFVYVFNSQMQNIYKSKTCAWNNVAQLDSLQLVGNWQVNQTINYSHFTKYLTLVDGKQSAAGYDYVIFFAWAKFVPKLSKEMLMQMRKQFETSNGKIYIGCVNLDFYNP